MGFFDRLFGAPEPQQVPQSRPVPQAPQTARLSEDELAVERYRYLLRTAPPESIEQVHTEAFAKLTPEQRQQLFRALSEQAPDGERIVSDEPSALARAATRQELRAPGSMERAFAGGRGGMQGGPSFGQMVGSSLLGTVAGVVIGSAIAQAFLPDPSGSEAGGAESTDAAADSGSDVSADAGAADASADGGGDAGGDFGGDFGGGDFGGFGDFGGGGDFGF